MRTAYDWQPETQLPGVAEAQRIAAEALALDSAEAVAHFLQQAAAGEK